MAKIKVELTEPLLNGMDVKFKAPCDCAAIDGLIVYYPLDDGSGTGNQTFVFKDAHDNTLTGLGNLFSAGVIVKVIVDVETGAAYIQNADTNKYLEDKIANAQANGTTVENTSTLQGVNGTAWYRATKVDSIVVCNGYFYPNGNFKYASCALSDVKWAQGMGDSIIPVTFVDSNFTMVQGWFFPGQNTDGSGILRVGETDDQDHAADFYYFTFSFVVG